VAGLSSVLQLASSSTESFDGTIMVMIISCHTVFVV